MTVETSTSFNNKETLLSDVLEVSLVWGLGPEDKMDRKCGPLPHYCCCWTKSTEYSRGSEIPGQHVWK